MSVLHGRWRFLCRGQLGFLSSFALGSFSAGTCPQVFPMAGASAPLKVCIVGSGNWGSAVAKIIGNNVKTMQKFASTVKMWVFEETINGRKLTDIINNDHENVKYLPGYKLPENVVAVPNLTEAVKDADLLVFVIPHQFIYKICDAIAGHVTKQAVGITLIKGIDEGPEGLRLISDVIRAKMGIDISVLMGANIANEVAAEKFCETTIGSKILENGLLFKELLQTPNFRITVVDDADTVEICGALKSIEELEQEMLNGQKLQGPQTSAEVYRILQQKGLVEKFPLFTAVYKICYEGKPVQEMISCLQSHPEHI
ncbi:glycerol-3-phosphate dehydrogenase 1-like protein isoform X3 [Crotalus tigris]|uniref:glycerol-3-phosphate dehydrogenase 1-like protein isoform X3 n=1 Tax=Crotalus tigris TaxID=88082 RepID=UPI00192F43AC|nr:glycerol-3-phosphate dehydrogenase 1-like protein isoform X3 [Crotalus tigris]